VHWRHYQSSVRWRPWKHRRAFGSVVGSMLALGYTNQKIGKKLYISVRTVGTHRAHIMLECSSKAAPSLVIFALANGVIGPSAD
jgi:hypothetical protein